MNKIFYARLLSPVMSYTKDKPEFLLGIDSANTASFICSMNCTRRTIKEQTLVIKNHKLTIYSISLLPDSDVVASFSIPSQIAHTIARAYKNKECVHALTCCVYVLTSLYREREH